MDKKTKSRREANVIKLRITKKQNKTKQKRPGIEIGTRLFFY